VFPTSTGTALLNNKIYKNPYPYSASNISWSTLSGFNTMLEVRNRPYLLPDINGLTDNSANIFSLNPSYLFYWDGKNLKAFNKATGVGVGTPLITTNTAKMSGGIYADACNNVYVGSVNGTIKVYNFNGSIFDDAPADIAIAGYATKSVYDIAYNEADKLLYASGDGFVAAYDISTTCPTNNVGFSLNIVANCATASATANLVPAAPTGSLVTYTLFIGTTQIASNSTGVFTSLLSLTNYKITATINPACSGIQVIGNFTLAGIAAPIVTTPITYCQGATATALTATGTNLLWYTSASGGGTGTTTAPIPNTTTAGTTVYYVSQSATAGSCESPRAQINVQVIAALAAPIVTTAITYCQGATATALTATGTNLLWYTSASGGGTGATIAPVPSTTTVGTTSYYVSQSATAGSCESPRAQINVQVIAPLAAPIVTTAITYCQGATATALIATGTNLLWYTTATNGTSSSTAPIPNTAAVGVTAYYVSQSATAGSCESPRAQINVQVIATLAAPIITTPITYCQGATATALTATGTNLLWYTTATGGGAGVTNSPIPNTTAIGTTAFYVSQSVTAGSCESPRAQINVQVIAPLAAPIVTTAITYCQGATTTALTATGTNLLWYTTATNGTSSSTAPIPNTTTAGTTAYYVSQSATVGSCESPRAQINVQVTTALAAPIVTTAITYCQGATATALTATGTNLLWYTSASGSGTGTTTAPIPNTTTIGTTAYYVSQSSAVGGCESPRATINVNITPLLTANAGNTITITAGTTTQLNATATAGADYTWSSNIAPISLSNINILNPIANPLQTTTYLLTVKDVLGNCPIVTSNVQVVVIGAQNCINIRNAFTPNADGINDTWLVYDQTFCLAKDGVSVKVFNRYGSKVYENNAYKNTWDGTYNVKPLPDGTYYAVIVFTLVDGRKQNARSDVTILR
jgi:gliding motility-associated-like protein